MTPEEAIAKLRTLPEDQQRAVLSRLSPDERLGIAQKLKAPASVEPEPAKRGFFGGMGSEIGGLAKGMVSPFSPPETPEESAIYGTQGPIALAVYRVGRGELQSRGEAFKQAGQQFKTAGTIKGDPELKGLQYLRSGVTGATGLLPVPGIASMSTNLNRVADTGNTRELAGRGLVDIAALALGGRKGGELERRAGEVDPVSGLERTVRSKIAPRMRPVNTDAYAKMVEIMREPDILPTLAEYADRTKNPMRDLLQLGRGATEAGKEITGYYRENLIDPNADIPAGDTGKTVGEAYKRVSEINEDLSPTYLKAGSKLTATIDSEKARALQAELGRLNNGIYQTLSERSGLPVEQIQAINRRGAQLQSLGKQFEVSHTTLEQGASGVDAAGNLLPHTPYHPVFQMAIKAVDALRGGRMAIQSRKVGRAVGNFPEGYTPLPDPEAIASYRRAVETSELGRAGSEADTAARNRAAAVARKPAGLGPTGPEFLKPEVLNPQQAVADFVKKQGERQAAGAERQVQARTGAERLAEARRQQLLRQQQQLARAKEIQGRAKIVPDYRGNQ